MIRIKGRAVVYGETWYDEVPDCRAGIDIAIHRHRHAPIEGARNEPFFSIVSDLAVDADLAARFDRDCRYKVRRADTKDGLSMELSLDPADRLAEFRAFYDAFAREKAVPACDPAWLSAACAARQLTVARAVQNGETLVWHVNVTSGRTVRMLHSASCFRTTGNDNRALIGRANRWLHWQEMLRFRQMGLIRYDWGGLFEDETNPQHAGVNRFKRSFGGETQRTWHCTVPLTLKGRAWLWLRYAWKRHKSPPAPARAAPQLASGAS